MKIAKLCILFVLVSSISFSQRKMPDFSFLDQSLEFADANKSFSDIGQLTDTLRDEYILSSLATILKDNNALHIELVGHTALNEDPGLGLKRANHIRSKLIAEGVDSSRIQTTGLGHTEPAIKDDVIFGLSSRVERDEANLRNRRVQVKVVAVKPETGEE
ncbi:MAG: OmpA family protein [Flavobacteriales bacterium]|jgi:flagellar motor protein MotB|nr:OmpA family protein [Flavobacteriales bacterium]